jgi:hypothetical protein
MVQVLSAFTAGSATDQVMARLQAAHVLCWLPGCAALPFALAAVGVSCAVGAHLLLLVRVRAEAVKGLGAC